MQTDIHNGDLKSALEAIVIIDFVVLKIRQTLFIVSPTDALYFLMARLFHH